MATTAKPALSDLHTRLDRLEERFAEIRSSNAAIEHEDLADNLTLFANRHLLIRSTIDETATDSALAKAEQDTSDLEQGIERWIADVDRKFESGTPRVDSVSM